MKYLKLFESDTNQQQDLEEVKTFLHDIQDLGVQVSLRQVPGTRPKFSITCDRSEVSTSNSFDLLGMLSELYNRMVGLGYAAQRNLVETGENGKDTCYFSFELVFVKVGKIVPKKAKVDLVSSSNFFDLICKQFGTTDNEVEGEVTVYESKYLNVYLSFSDTSTFKIIYDGAAEYDLQDMIDGDDIGEKDGDWLFDTLYGSNEYDFSQKSFNMISKMVHLLEKYDIGS